MDPDEALRLFRKCMARAREAAEGDSNDAEIQALQNAARYAEVLDRWLSQGGFLPEAWGVRVPVDRVKDVLLATGMHFGAVAAVLNNLTGKND